LIRTKRGCLMMKMCKKIFVVGKKLGADES